MTEVSVEPSNYQLGQELMDRYGDEGLLVVTAITQGFEHEGVAHQDVVAFVERNQLDYPVLADSAGEMLKHGVRGCHVDTLVAPDMTVVAYGNLPISDTWIENKLGLFNPVLD